MTNKVLPLQEADATARDELLSWLDEFAGYVRDVDYASAKPMFHAEVLAFGTHRDVISGLEQWVSAQWDKVWPNTSDFRFDLNATRVLIADDGSSATVVAPWNSSGYHSDGSSFERPGRATMVLHRIDDRWLCVHSHMSLNRGVPQQSQRQG